jgi:hypothetical protein
MGKGGENTVSQQRQPFKLNSYSTEELRKWAKAYGIDGDKERESLLKELVRR